MTFKSFVLLSGAALMLASIAAQAQDDEDTIRAIPNPAADLPAAVTQEIFLPDAAADSEGAGHSAAGRSGERRDAGLDTARGAGTDGLEHAPEVSGGEGPDSAGEAPDSTGEGLETAGDVAAGAAADGLATAADAIARGDDFGHDIAEATDASREAFGRSHAPDELPVPQDLPVPDAPPTDLPPAPPGG